MKRFAAIRPGTALAALLAIVLAALPAPPAWAAPGDVVIPRKDEETSEEFMAPSIFPHWVHRINYRCDACHDRLFEMKLGASEITMELMNQGKSCGTCHNGETAFAVDFDGCHRCHRAPEE